MELRPLFTIVIYITFQDLYVTVNLHMSKEDYAITIKQSKKNKKGELQKM